MTTPNPTPEEAAARVARQIESGEAEFGKTKYVYSGHGIQVEDLRALLAERASLAAKDERLRDAISKQNEEISQTLGRALGYPWFKDDPANFPDATEADGVCVGEHVAESLADEAAQRIASLAAERGRLAGALEPFAHGAIFDATCDWDLDAYCTMSVEVAQREIIAALATSIAQNIVSAATPYWLNSAPAEKGRVAWNIKVFAANGKVVEANRATLAQPERREGSK